MITVFAAFVAKPGKEAELEEELLSMAGAAMEEEGCINYDLLRDVQTNGKFALYENWAEKADLDRHMSLDRVKSFLARIGELLAAKTRIELYEMVD